jgi:trans-2,3-dihydro-3-hydroxyanthranilate isomerase
VRVRIFTVQEEVPFAGHPTLGTAFALRTERDGEEVALELGVGRVPVRFERRADGQVFGEMTQVAPPASARSTILVRWHGAVCIEVTDLDSSLPIQTVSTGLPFTIVPLRSLAVARAIRLDVNRRRVPRARAEQAFLLRHA